MFVRWYNFESCYFISFELVAKMLGPLRFILASFVIMFHLTSQVPNIGQLSVNFFYVISGYLITLILNETYKRKSKAFAINRFLRLYPTYYFFATISLLFAFVPISGATTASFHPSWVAQQGVMDWLGNLFIFPWAFVTDYAVVSIPHFMVSESFRFRLIPSTWSIAVEITCYFILWAFSARKLSFAIMTFILAVAAHIVVHYSSLTSEYAYAPFFVALLPFSMGSIGYFISSSIEKKITNIIANQTLQYFILLFIVTIFVLNWHASTHSLNFYSSFEYYINNIIAMIAVMSMHKSQLNGSISKISKLLGDLSYPLFLCQYIAGYIGWTLIGKPQDIRGWAIFCAGYAVAIVMSLVSVKLIDNNIATLRNKIRPKNKHNLKE